MNRLPSASLGDGRCPVCKHVGKIKTTTAGFAYINCDHVGNGGCQTQVMARSEKGSLKLCEGMLKWYDGMKAKFLGASAARDVPPQNPSSPKAPTTPSPSPKAATRRPPKEPKPAPEPRKQGFLDWKL